MVRGSSPHNPVVIYEGTDRISLFAGQSYVISSLHTRLGIGTLKFVLHICTYEGDDLKDFTELRNDLYRSLGLTKPLSCLHSLPRPQSWLKLGSVLAHNDLGGGSFGWVQAGVHYQTGEPLAVKTVRVGSRIYMKEVLSEVEVSLAFPDVPGLLQAREVRCYHGCSIDPVNFRQQGDAHFCSHRTVTIFMVFPLAIRDFAKQDWSLVSLPVKVQLIRGILEGLSALHKAGWMHRDLSPQNVLILSEKPPTAVIADYGKAVQEETAYSANIGPLYIQAPEVDGTYQYSNRIDVWSCGLIICTMIIPEQFKQSIKREPPRNPNLGPELIAELEIYGNNGVQENAIARLVKRMISNNPNDRARAAKVTSSGHSDGPLAKKAKASDDHASRDDGQLPGLLRDGVFKDLAKEDEDLLAGLGDLSEFGEFGEQAADGEQESEDGERESKDGQQEAEDESEEDDASAEETTAKPPGQAPTTKSNEGLDLSDGTPPSRTSADDAKSTQESSHADAQKDEGGVKRKSSEA
ncbi:MAG: hypothetical protein Q9212_003213 [Teloschistes hypoglaucus]